VKHNWFSSGHMLSLFTRVLYVNLARGVAWGLGGWSDNGIISREWFEGWVGLLGWRGSLEAAD